MQQQSLAHAPLVLVTVTGLEINFFYSLPYGQVALICVAHAGMYSVAFMHYWLPDLQYYLPRACGQALNASPGLVSVCLFCT